jgi:hypothetical protein
MKGRLFSFATSVLLSIPLVFLSGCGLGIVPGDFQVTASQDALTGTYTFLTTLFIDDITSGHAPGSALIGSITFDGVGGISGEVDINSNTLSSSTHLTYSATGAYTFTADHRGTLTLVPISSSGIPLKFAFSAADFVSGIPQTLRFIGFDENLTGVTGSGVAKRVTASAFTPATLSQTFVFGLQGETPCDTCNGSVYPFGPLSVAGRFTGSNFAVTSGQQDAAAVNVSYNAIGMSGAFTAPDASGRGTLTLAYTGSLYPAPPAHFLYYLVNSSELFLMSSDGHASTSLLIGDALVQSGTYTSASLSGAYITYSSGGFNGDGRTLYPTVSTNTAGRIAITSTGYLTVLADLNNGNGEISAEAASSIVPYAVDSNGRMTIGPGLPVFYLADNGHLFGTAQPGPGAGTNPALLTVEPQTGSAFSCADLTGNLSLGTLPTPLPVNDSSGYMAFTNPTANAVLDQVANSITTSGATATFTCSADNLSPTTGRLLFTSPSGTFAAYAIAQGQRYVTVDMTPANTTPTIHMLEK